MLHLICGKTWEGKGCDNLWGAIFNFIAKDVVNMAITQLVVVLDV